MKTKTKKFSLALLVALFFSPALFAFDDSLKVKNENSIVLLIDDVKPGTQLTFKDKQSHILFEQILDTSEVFAKTFNIELLPVGDYLIEITDDTRIKTVPLNINKNGIQVLYTESSEYFKPFIREKGSLVYVNQFSPEGTPLYVAIYNRNNELVYEDHLKGNMALGKVYDFSKSMPGQYRIYLESRGLASQQLLEIRK